MWYHRGIRVGLLTIDCLFICLLTLGLSGCHLTALPEPDPSALFRLRLSLAYLQVDAHSLSKKNLQMACALTPLTVETEIVAAYLWHKLGYPALAEALYKKVYTAARSDQWSAIDGHLRANGLPTAFSGYLEFLVTQKRYHEALEWLKSETFRQDPRHTALIDPTYARHYLFALAYLEACVDWQLSALPDWGFYFSPVRLRQKRRVDRVCYFAYRSH